MKEEYYNELKDYTDGQLLSGIALAVMHRLYCKDMFKEATDKYEQYKDLPELAVANNVPETIKHEYNKWKFAVEHASEIEHAYKEMLIERNIIKMGSEVV